MFCDEGGKAFVGAQVVQLREAGRNVRGGDRDRQIRQRARCANLDVQSAVGPWTGRVSVEIEIADRDSTIPDRTYARRRLFGSFTYEFWK